MKPSKLTRREFIRISALAAGSAALTACQAQPTAVPTEVPAAAATETLVPTKAAQPTATMAQPTATAVPTPLTAEELLVKAGLPLPLLPDQGWKVTFPDLPAGMPIDPPINLTINRIVGSDVVFAEGDDIDNNPFTRMAKTLFGIDWKVKWTAPGWEDDQTKWNLAVAANDIPDVGTYISGDRLVNGLQAGLFEDITDAYENYASQKWVKDVFAQYGDLPWAYARVKGRLMGWPYVEQAVQNDKVMWMRKDWLDKLGLAVPTTLDELYEVATAFHKSDLGQGAKGTTLGIAFQQELVSWYGSADPIVGSITGTLPNYWTENDKGQLENGIINPRMKDALAFLAKWYAEGLLPADFATRPTAEAQKLVAGNLCGIHFTPHWDAGWGCGESIANDPEAVWVPYEIPAGPAGKKKLWTNPFTSAIWPLRKGNPNADAYVKQCSWLVELFEDPEKLPGGNYAIKDVTFEIVDGEYKPIPNVYFPKWVHGPILGNGNGGVNPERAYIHMLATEKWNEIPEEQRNPYQKHVLNDPTGVQERARKAFKLSVSVSREQGIVNQFNAPPTQGMVDFGADLNTLWAETWTGIVTGQKPPEAFDEFVTNWKSLGGDQITQEVNDWWASR